MAPLRTDRPIRSAQVAAQEVAPEAAQPAQPAQGGAATEAGDPQTLRGIVSILGTPKLVWFHVALPSKASKKGPPFHAVTLWACPEIGHPKMVNVL